MRRNQLTESFSLSEILTAGLAAAAKTYFRESFPPQAPTGVCNYPSRGWLQPGSAATPLSPTCAEGLMYAREASGVPLG